MIKYRPYLAEFIGTAVLLCTVVGSGIMGERLSGGNTAIALLANSLATGGILMALIFAFREASGANFNPVVTIAAVIDQKLPWKFGAAYIIAQTAGAFSGVMLANVMFGLPAIFPANHQRSGLEMLISETVATFGLVLVILACIKGGAGTKIPYAVAGYIVAGYWFTPSTCFANPAVTIARAFTDTFSGISLKDVPGFIAGQLIGAVCGFVIARILGTDRGSIEEGK